MPHIRCQHAVVPFTVRFSAEAYMMRFYTGTLKQHRSVVVIYRSRNQSVAHTHSPMLPCQILTVIEIIVTTAYLEFGKRAGYPVIQNRSRLILRTETFPQHPAHPPVPGQCHFQSQLSVFPHAILHEHLRMVLEEMLHVSPYLPVTGIIRKCRVPASAMVSLHILQRTLLSRH